MNGSERKQALISVTDKTGLETFSRLKGWRIISTGGTAERLRELHIPYTPVEDVTGVYGRETLGGKVKTLHPRIFWAIRADRGNRSEMAMLQNKSIVPIDLVVSNFYEPPAIPQAGPIDVGGPAMLVAAASNWTWVSAVSDPDHYELVVQSICASRDSAVPMDTREWLAKAAFQYVANYYLTIAHRWDLGFTESARRSDLVTIDNCSR